MKPYASYKPSGVAWLNADIPSQWISKRIKHVAAMQSGEGITAETIDQSGTYPVYGGNGIRGFTAKKTHSGEFVLVGRQGALCGNVHHVVGDFWASEHAVVSALYAGDNPRWAAYILEFMNLGQYSMAAAQPGLAVDKIQQLQLPVPPPDEQQAIADYLDTETARIDTLVQEKEELIGLLREARSNRISELISGDGLPGSATGNPWAPHLPEGWQLKRLKHLAQVRSGLAKGKDTGSNTTVELPYLRVANVQEGRLDLREISTMPVEVDAVERFSLLEGDVLMNEGGDYDKVGRGAVWTGEISPCLHQNHVFAVRPVQRDLSEWISAITQTQYAKFYFMNNAKQSTNLASISQASVKELPIPLPPKEQRDALLEKLGGELAAFDALITHTQEEIALLKELRAATIADAVLGRVDVRSLTQKQ